MHNEKLISVFSLSHNVNRSWAGCFLGPGDVVAYVMLEVASNVSLFGKMSPQAN